MVALAISYHGVLSPDLNGLTQGRWRQPALGKTGHAKPLPADRQLESVEV